MKIVAWMTDDGRVATDDTKQTAMPNASKEVFHIPLVRMDEAGVRLSAASTKRFAANFGLTPQDLQQLLQASLKPEEISGPPDVQHERVYELVLWFRRLAAGQANPKWATQHAFELAFYIASNSVNRTIDLHATKQAAYIEGVNISPGDRGILERLNLIQPTTSCDRAPAGWKCSRAKDHYGPCAAHPTEASGE